MHAISVQEMSSDMASMVSRLEAVTTRLEALAAKGGAGAKAGGAAEVCEGELAGASLCLGRAIQNASSSSSSFHAANTEMVDAFDNEVNLESIFWGERSVNMNPIPQVLKGKLKKYLERSAAFGGEIAEHVRVTKYW